MKRIILILPSLLLSILLVAQSDRGIAKGSIVTLADGLQISIEEIKIDDLLLAFNPENNTIGVNKVVKVEKTSSKNLNKIILANGYKLTMTKDHPITGDVGWISADSKATKRVEEYKNKKVNTYRVDSFIYTFNEEYKMEVPPIIEIQSVSVETEVYRLVLDSSNYAFIVNGIFVGQ